MLAVFQVLRKDYIKASKNYFSEERGLKGLLLNEHQKCFFAYFPLTYFAVENPEKKMSAYEYALKNPNVPFVQNGGYFHKNGKATGGVVSNSIVVSKMSFDKGRIGNKLSYWHCSLFSAVDANGNLSIHMLDSRNLKPYRKYVEYTNEKNEIETYLYLDSRFIDAPKIWKKDKKLVGKSDCKFLVTEQIEAGKSLIYDGKLLKRTFYKMEKTKRRRSGIGIANDKHGAQVIVSITTRKEMPLSELAKFAKENVKKDGYTLIDFMSLDGGNSSQMVCDGKLQVISSDVPENVRDAIEEDKLESLKSEDMLLFDAYNRKLPNFIIYSDRRAPTNPFEKKPGK